MSKTISGEIHMDVKFNFYNVPDAISTDDLFDNLIEAWMNGNAELLGSGIISNNYEEDEDE